MNSNPLIRTAMQFGAYSGLSSFAFFLLLYFVTSNPMGQKSWFGAWIPIVFIVLATKFHRDKDLGGYINYGRGLSIGILVGGFAALLNAVLSYIFGTMADQFILENYKSEAMVSIDEARKFLSGERMLAKLDEAVEQIDKMTMTQLSLSVFYNGSLGGLIVSLITAAIFRKPKPFFDDQGSTSPN